MNEPDWETSLPAPQLIGRALPAIAGRQSRTSRDAPSPHGRGPSTSTATAYYATAACISSRASTTLSDASKTQSASTT
jgi:hypothetical protein